jgi:hypothetical protein
MEEMMLIDLNPLNEKKNSVADKHNKESLDQHTFSHWGKKMQCPSNDVLPTVSKNHKMNWRQIVDKWCERGQPCPTKWCEEQKIPYRPFLQWRKKLCVDKKGKSLFVQRQSPKKTPSIPPFVEIKGEIIEEIKNEITVQYKGALIKLGDKFNHQALKTCLHILKKL